MYMRALDRVTEETAKKAIDVAATKAGLRERRLGWLGHIMRSDRICMTPLTTVERARRKRKPKFN